MNIFWVIVESDDGEIIESSLEVLTEVSRLSKARENDVVVITCGAGDLKEQNWEEEMGSYGAVEILYLEDYHKKTSREVAVKIAETASKGKPEVIFAAETIWGHDMAAWTAVELKTSFLANCVELGIGDNNQLQASRHIYNNTVSIKYDINEKETVVVTVQPGLFNPKKDFTGNKPRITNEGRSSGFQEPVCFEEFIKADPRTVDIEDAERLVTGGGGMGTAENFELIQEVADILGAAVGGTRVARDNGWISLERQIGQTGKTVAPELLISCGVSGAIQHTMGLKDTKCLIAINIHKHAPIHKIADLSIVDDAPSVLRDFIAKFKTECH